MQRPSPSPPDFTHDLETLQSQTREELEQTRQQLQEIQLLAQQTASEVEKLYQRETALANRVRDMENHFESYSRTDIRAFYNANHEMQLRLFMMRSQAEQLQAREENLRQYQDKLRTILDLTNAHHDLARTAALKDAAVAEQSRTSGEGLSAEAAKVALLEAKEEERLQLAQDLQDGPMQSLSNVLLQLEICKQVLKFDADAAQQELDGVRTVLLSTLRDTRRMLTYIRPLTIDELGLGGALRRDLDELGRQRGVTVTMEDRARAAMPIYFQLALFRLVQRIATAMLTPEQPGQLGVALRSAENRLAITIEVTGPEQVDTRERAAAVLASAAVAGQLEALDGATELDGADTTGVTLTIEVPLPNPAP